jgi:Tfp pilus assembly protein PilO
MDTERTEKGKNLVLNLAIIIVAGIVAFNIYQNSEKEKANLNSKIAEEQQKSKLLEDISKQDKRLNAYKKLLTKKDPSLAMATISNIAKGFGVQIVTMKPGVELRVAEYLKSPFNLVLDVPSYHALGKFISALESSKDVYVVDSVEILSEGEGGSGKLTANITISTIALTD